MLTQKLKIVGRVIGFVAAALAVGHVRASGPAPRTPALAAEVGPAAPVNRGIFGVNNSNADASWSPHDPAYVALIRALGATRERYIGGSQSSFWEWEAGHYVPADEITRIWPAEHGNWMLPLVEAVNQQPATEHGPLAFAEFAENAGVTVQWMTNLTTRAEDQPAMMRHLKENGVPVEYVELDNETYFWGAEFGGGIDRPQNYAERVRDFSPIVRELFPDAGVGVVASENGVFVEEMHSGDSKGDPAFTEWNRVLTRPKNRPMYDAFVLHHYVMNAGTLDDVGDDPADLGRAFLTCPQVTLDRAVGVLAQEYGGVPMWITEFNVIGYYRIGNPDDEVPDGEVTPADRWIKSTANTPWNALYQAGFWVAAMRHPGAIGNLNHHSVRNVDLGWGLGLPVSETEADITATGQLFAHLSHLGERAETMAPLTFVGNPILPNGFGGAEALALDGAALASADGTTFIVINRGDEPLSINLPSGTGDAELCVYSADEEVETTARVKLNGDVSAWQQGPMRPETMHVDAGVAVEVPGFSLAIVETAAD